MTFGTELYKWRKAKGLTQQELAVASGVNVSYISNLERDFSPTAKGGKPQPSLSLVDKIAKVLSIEPDEARLAAGYAPENVIQQEIPESVREAFAREGTLSENDQILIANFVEMLKKQKREAEEKS